MKKVFIATLCFCGTVFFLLFQKVPVNKSNGALSIPIHQKQNVLIVAWFRHGGIPISAAAEALSAQGFHVTILGAIEDLAVSDSFEWWVHHIERADIVIWWSFWTPVSSWKRELRKLFPMKTFVIFNWDEPHVTLTVKSLSMEHLSVFDFAFISSTAAIPFYQKAMGSKNAFFLAPPFDSSKHFADHSQSYAFDVCFVLTNLYDGFSNAYASRRAVISRLISDGIDVKIFGPEFLRADFPKNYAGFIQPTETRKVFSSCKINLNIHVNQGYGGLYLNERDIQVLASGGLLLTEKPPVSPALSEKECVFLEGSSPEEISRQVQKILRSYNKFEHIRANGFRLAKANFSATVWASTLAKHLRARTFHSVSQEGILLVISTRSDAKALLESEELISRLFWEFQEYRIPWDCTIGVIIRETEDTRNVSFVNCVAFQHKKGHLYSLSQGMRTAKFEAVLQVDASAWQIQPNCGAILKSIGIFLRDHGGNAIVLLDDEKVNEGRQFRPVMSRSIHLWRKSLTGLKQEDTERFCGAETPQMKLKAVHNLYDDDEAFVPFCVNAIIKDMDIFAVRSGIMSPRPQPAVTPQIDKPIKKRKFLIVGHWVSANLGDRYQPYVVYQHLLSRGIPQTSLELVNFSDDGDNRMFFQLGGKEYEVFGPSRAETTGCSHAIFTTGSMDSGSPYVGFIKKLLNLRVTVFIWGGMSRGYLPLKEFAETLSFLKHPNVRFLARTPMDLQLFREVVNDVSKGTLGGDPMAWWFHYSDKNERKRETPLKGVVSIISMHCFEYERWRFWDVIVNRSDHLLCIDGFADKDVLKSHPRARIVTEPWILQQLVSGASHVISGRLHGALYSALSRVPTSLVAIDSPESRAGSFKFEAYCDFGMCRLIHPEKSELRSVFQVPQVNTTALETMLRVTNESLGLIAYEISRSS